MNGLKTLYKSDGKEDGNYACIEVGLEHGKALAISITSDLSETIGVSSKATVVLTKEEVYEIIEVLSAHMNI